MKVWQCSVCKYIHRGDKPPEKCPICNVPASKFKEIDETSISQKRIEVKKTAAGSAAGNREPLVEQSNLQKIYSLLIKHHAHPVSTHTPNGILPAAVILWIAAWIFNYDILSKAALINMIFVVIALPFVVFTGVLEWQKKYNSALTSLFKIKILAATITCIMCITSIVWYLINPDVLLSPDALLFILINIIMVAAAGIAGYIGGKLVFKD